MPFLDPGPAVAAGGDQVSDSTDGARANELVRQQKHVSMLALDTCDEQAEKEENRRVPHVAHVRFGHKTTCRKSASHAARV